MQGSANWLASVDNELIKKHYGDEVYARVHDLVENRRVRHLVVSENQDCLRGLVRGTDGVNIRVTITIEPTKDGVPDWKCVCTGQADSKSEYCAALLMVARDAGKVMREPGAQAEEPAAAPAKPAADLFGDWRAVMDSLAGSADVPDSDQPNVTVGLQFQRGNTSGQTIDPRIKIRPVALGKDNRWLPQGVSWHELKHPMGRPPVEPAQLAVLRDMWETSRNQQPNPSARGPIPEFVYLDDLDASIWRLMRAAVDAGITLVGHRDGPEEVELCLDPAVATLDAIRPKEDGALLIRAVATIGEDVLRGSFINLLGEPAHGLLAIDPGISQVPPLLRMAEFRSPLDGVLRQLMATNRRIEIPAEESVEFLSRYGPSLANKLPVVSTDDSVTMPEVGDPVIGLQVSYENERNIATLHWSMAYPVAGAHVHVPFDPEQSASQLSTAPARFPRDLSAEVALREAAKALRLPRSARRSPDATEEADLVADIADQVPLVTASLSAADTALFTHEHLPKLEADDRVVVTTVGTTPTFKAAATLPRVELRPMSDDDVSGDWFDLGISIEVDGEKVHLNEIIAAIVHGDDAVVLQSGVWFSLEHPHLESLRRMVAESRELIDVDAETLRINVFRPDLWAELLRDSHVVDHDRRWLRQLQGLANLAEIPSPGEPEGLLATLRPYQEDGYRWLSFLWDHRLGGILADDMGLGKTMQSLAAICRQHEAGNLTGPVLIVAPTSVVTTWRSEAGKFAPHLTTKAITQTATKRAETLASLADECDIIITSYTLLRLDAEEYQSISWSATIFDEAQFVKNHTSTTYRTARQLKAPFRLAVTGTPLENSLMDLWSLLSLTASGLFPDPAEFTSYFRKPIEAGKAPERLAALRRRIRPFVLRRSKSQVATDLPPKQEQILPVELTEEHRALYDKHLQRERQRVMGLLDDMSKNRMVIFKSLTMLRQLALDPSLVDSQHPPVTDGSKLGVFIEHIQELIAEGHRALVFSQFTGYLSLVRAELDKHKITHAYLDGSTRDRQGAVEEFTDNDAPVFLISLKAGGFGLTLTQADYVFVLDPWWNPAAEAQAIDRAHRIGQDKHVMVYRLVATDTIEEKVLALQERKRALFDQVVDDGAVLSSVLSADDVRSLFGSE